jgi:glycosyltransferase involved in cell wall biosynthesis
MEVSILICTKGRRSLLGRLMTTIRKLDYPGKSLEIIVVEETNNPRPLRGVTYIPIPLKNFGIGYARNIALRYANKPIVVFVDDDCEVEKDWLTKLTHPFSDSEVAGVAGAVKVKNCNAIGWAENIIGVPGGGLRYIANAKSRSVPTYYLSTVNCAYRKEVVLSQGGFDSRAEFGGEDGLLANKVCRTDQCVYIRDAVVYHKPRGNLGRIFKWFIQRGRAEIGVWFLDEKRAERGFHLCQSSITLKVLVCSIIGVLLGYFYFFVGSFFILYVFFNLFRTRWAINFGTPFVGWILVPAIKIVMDMGTDIGKVKEVISQLKKWTQGRNASYF